MNIEKAKDDLYVAIKDLITSKSPAYAAGTLSSEIVDTILEIKGAAKDARLKEILRNLKG